MRIKYVDNNGSLTTEYFEDDADFSVQESDGKFYIQVYKSPHTNQSGKLYRKVIALSSDKAIANKCIERIDDQLNDNKSFCDLVDIQRGELVDTDHTDQNNN